ncbi:hypothetical protein SADUNF_Sadunf12G0081300 [Salix dunnii]|uniref:Endonuclease/exonuclease/phosphatase domain-containing protein n=1 Tax=Salix dunnii TaxID=1413687 RepID=A0A835JRM2_9ROSI|nr:hypothetical protein SADUNF_Sadunf12G0081300 [Salix dunnii]
MLSIGSWNIRGINHPNKQKTVREWTTKNKLDIIGLLEVKIASSNLPSVIEGLSLDNWGHLSNDDGMNPSRILVSWNKATCNLSSIHSSPQWLTCEVSSISNSYPFRITFIYGQNTPTRRVDLWNYIAQHQCAFSSKPWLIQGDFNAIMGRNDRSGGSTMWHGHQEDFSQCMKNAELMEIPYTGLRYTWHNSQAIGTIHKKLDWSFGNAAFFNKWIRGKEGKFGWGHQTNIGRDGYHCSKRSFSRRSSAIKTSPFLNNTISPEPKTTGKEYFLSSNKARMHSSNENTFIGAMPHGS